MEYSQVVLILVVGVFAEYVLSYPNQVPATDLVCKTMTPGHGPHPQKSQSPYTISVSTQNIKSGESVEVSLKGASDFKGFYVQARSGGQDGTPIGKFFPQDEHAKVHNCGSGQSNAIFHGTTGSRNNVKFTWKPPKDFNGDVSFVATFVQEFNTFWTKNNGGSVSVA